jgi:hypothetical protein
MGFFFDWSSRWRAVAVEEGIMTTLRKPTASIYVDHSSQQWIVRDLQGDFWILPAVDHPWNHREPVELTEEMELEPVPGHYKYLLDLPF